VARRRSLLRPIFRESFELSRETTKGSSTDVTTQILINFPK